MREAEWELAPAIKSTREALDAAFARQLYLEAGGSLARQRSRPSTYDPEAVSSAPQFCRSNSAPNKGSAAAVAPAGERELTSASAPARVMTAAVRGGAAAAATRGKEVKPPKHGAAAAAGGAEKQVIAGKREAADKHLSAAGYEAASVATATTQRSSEEEQFEVEAVLDMKRSAQNGEFLFFAKWQGYPVSDNSWEPTSCFDTQAMWKPFAQKLSTVMERLVALGASRKQADQLALEALRGPAKWSVEAAATEATATFRLSFVHAQAAATEAAKEEESQSEERTNILEPFWRGSTRADSLAATHADRAKTPGKNT